MFNLLREFMEVVEEESMVMMVRKVKMELVLTIFLEKWQVVVDFVEIVVT